MQGSAVLATAALSRYAEAQFAGWVASPPELRARSAPTQAPKAESADADALVTRFYSCQEC